MEIQPGITVDGLRVERNGTRVFEGLSLSVARGAVTGLLGPNGSGKSTLMRAIVGVQRVQGGTIDVLGEPAGSPSLRSRVAYVTQAPSVYGDITVGENLHFFSRVLAAPEASIEAALRTVDLLGEADRVVNRLSGGQRARVSLATALLGDPELLVLDEPTVGLDPLLRRELWDTFHGLARENRAVLVSSHVMDEAERCDELLLLRDGLLLATGTLPEILERTGAGDLEGAFLRLVDEAAP
ncbi:MAG TPA: ABC transporter ATP-binding protein [Gaiellaceae bacterium]|nr:ABC transporter ATP-binding protein [Gaiellaceae bacterium]